MYSTPAPQLSPILHSMHSSSSIIPHLQAFTPQMIRLDCTLRWTVMLETISQFHRNQLLYYQDDSHVNSALQLRKTSIHTHRLSTVNCILRRTCAHIYVLGARIWCMLAGSFHFVLTSDSFSRVLLVKHMVWGQKNWRYAAQNPMSYVLNVYYILLRDVSYTSRANIISGVVDSEQRRWPETPDFFRTMHTNILRCSLSRLSSYMCSIFM